MIGKKEPKRQLFGLTVGLKVGLQRLLQIVLILVLSTVSNTIITNTAKNTTINTVLNNDITGPWHWVFPTQIAAARICHRANLISASE